MKKLQGLGKSLTKIEQKKIIGGGYGTQVQCNCYNRATGPETGTDATCTCPTSISSCCGEGFDSMNCGGCGL
jgi:hypothetical protein